MDSHHEILTIPKFNDLLFASNIIITVVAVPANALQKLVCRCTHHNLYSSECSSILLLFYFHIRLISHHMNVSVRIVMCAVRELVSFPIGWVAFTRNQTTHSLHRIKLFEYNPKIAVAIFFACLVVHTHQLMHARRDHFFFFENQKQLVLEWCHLVPKFHTQNLSEIDRLRVDPHCVNVKISSCIFVISA